MRRPHWSGIADFITACAESGDRRDRTAFRSARQAFRLTVLCHVGDCQEMECDAICFNVCIAMALLIFAPAKSPQRDVQL